MSAAVDKLLARLDRPRQTRPGNWVAGCPCCQSRRGRPISVREVDGRALVHPFCGCDMGDVLGALGLAVSDLFDAPLEHTSPVRSRIPATDLLELVGYEIDAAGILLAEVVEGRSISEPGWERLAQAARRINQARTHLYGR